MHHSSAQSADFSRSPAALLAFVLANESNVALRYGLIQTARSIFVSVPIRRIAILGLRRYIEPHMNTALSIPDAAGAAHDLLALGALIIRLDPGVVPFAHADDYRLHVAGGEYNVAANLSACFGRRTAVATAMVDYPLGRRVEFAVQKAGVAPYYARFKHDGVRGPNIATVWSDRGQGMRAPTVFYNRANEAAQALKPGSFDWPAIFGGGAASAISADNANNIANAISAANKNNTANESSAANAASAAGAAKADASRQRPRVRWFHSGGIFASLSPSCADLIIEAMQAAKKAGAVVSFDLNYRAKLWAAAALEEGLSAEQAGERAALTLRKIAAHVDVLVGNEEDLQKGLGIMAPGAEGRDAGAGSEAQGSLDPAAFFGLIEKAARDFPNIKAVATSLREVRSASRHSWSAVLWLNGKRCQAPTMELDVYDRVGGGDGFSSGLFYGLLSGAAPEEALKLGWAHGALLTTTPGDTTMVSLDQVEALAAGASARIQR